MLQILPCFGVKEARLHRERGISLQMFLGLYKYYRYAFIDLVREMPIDAETSISYQKFVERVFDLIEIAFCSEWSGLKADTALLELQESNRRMTNEKNKYLTLFESIDRPAFLIDRQGVIDNLNESAIILLKLSLRAGALYYPVNEDEAGSFRRPIIEYIPWLSDKLEEFFTSGEQFMAFTHVETDADKRKHFDVHLARMRDVSGKFEGGVITIEDTTKKVMLEESLSQARKLEGIGVLASGVAHEVNTPIQFIGHNLQFIDSVSKEIEETLACLTKAEKNSCATCNDEDFQELMEDLPEAIRESLEGVENIKSIVKAMKVFGHPAQDSTSSLDLNELVQNVVTISRNAWKNSAEVVQEYLEPLPRIIGIGGEINQVVLNIIMNAIDAIEETGGNGEGLGEIRVATNLVGDMVELTISDTGAGIAQEDLHRIFDPFYTTKPPGKGTGQGLSIAYALVNKHGGEIKVSSSEGKGTTFQILLPAANL